MDLDPVFWSYYLGLGVVCTVIERIWPAHRVRYRKVVPLDLVALVVYQFAWVPIAAWLTARVVLQLRTPTPLLELPLAVRLLIVYIVGDCGGYWMHRLLHTRQLWRTHRWHHSSTQLYWLSGVRSTLLQQLLFTAPYVLCGVVLFAEAPEWLLLAIGVEAVVRNNWMHMNVSWRSSWLEWVVVTPRYHQIHHSSDAELHNGNYGSLFTIWDRLFGTYIDPDVTKVKAFGTGEPKRDPVLLMIGV